MSRVLRVALDRTFVVDEVTPQSPPEGHVRLAVSYCGISGADAYLRSSEAKSLEGAVLGHEISARVDEIGAGVHGWQRGDRVCVQPLVPCQECESCRADNPQVCPRSMAAGIGIGAAPGGYAEHVTVPVSNLVRIPLEVTQRDAALAEPTAVALHILDQAGLAQGESLAVIGGGPIGMLTALCARATGNARIVVLERNEKRAAALSALGLSVVTGVKNVHERTVDLLGEPPKVVLECAGHPAAPQLAVELVATHGRIVLTGMLAGPVGFSLLLAVLKEVELRTSMLYRHSDFDRALRLLATGCLPTDAIITDVVSLEEAAEALMELRQPATPHLKILCRP